LAFLLVQGGEQFRVHLTPSDPHPLVEEYGWD
jgi:hypothetical protein